MTMTLKIIVSLITFLSLLFLSCYVVYADPSAQPSFLKVNGAYTSTYQVYITSLKYAEFNMPGDYTLDNFLANQNISFELDKTFMPLGVKDLDTAQFNWDFGDGIHGSGLKQTHTYSKIGSYILTINIANAPGYVPLNPDRPFDAVLINIVPNTSYRLPQAIIRANGKMVENPLLDSIMLDFSKKIQFDGLESQAGSSPITSYFWDFGDTKSSQLSSTVHSFDPGSGNSFVTMRVVDANGFLSDTFIEIDNSLLYLPIQPSEQQSTKVTILSRPNANNEISKLYLSINDLLKRLTSRLFTNKGIDYLLLGLVIIFAFIAGGLHALTPGHGKSLMAAFLVGKGTNKYLDVFIISVAITIAHTSIIYIFGFLLILININYPVAILIPYFNKISAVLICLLAIRLLYVGFHRVLKNRSSGHIHEQIHTHINNKNSNYSELFIAGLSGGLVPCIDALALLLFAIGIHQLIFGLFIVFVFSVGLASSIVVLGLLLVIGKNRFKVEQKLMGYSQIIGPILSGIFILFLAINLFNSTK